jgi:TonB family protein
MELGSAGRCRITMRFTLSSIVAIGLATASVISSAECDSLPEACPATGALFTANGATKILGEQVLASRAIGCVAPRFPPLARQARLDGFVRIGVLVNETGHVSCAHMISGHPILIGSAIEAARQWVFRPVIQQGRPMSVYGILAFHYSTSGVGKSRRSCLDAHWDSPPTLSTSPPIANPTAVAPSWTWSKLIRQPSPTYPEEAKSAHVEGVVHLAIIISRDGDVREVRPISGHPLLLPAAIEAVKQWKYAPALRNGIPVEESTQADVSFKLSQ